MYYYVSGPITLADIHFMIAGLIVLNLFFIISLIYSLTKNSHYNEGFWDKFLDVDLPFLPFFINFATIIVDGIVLFGFIVYKIYNLIW